MLVNLFKYWGFIKSLIDTFPKVMEVVKKVELVYSASTGEQKKMFAKRILADDLPVPPTWCKQDWEEFYDGLIDAIVALLHWRGVFKHGPSHPCYKGE